MRFLATLGVPCGFQVPKNIRDNFENSEKCIPWLIIADLTQITTTWEILRSFFAPKKDDHFLGYVLTLNTPLIKTTITAEQDRKETYDTHDIGNFLCNFWKWEIPKSPRVQIQKSSNDFGRDIEDCPFRSMTYPQKMLTSRCLDSALWKISGGSIQISIQIPVDPH